MEYVRFDNEEINEYFSQELGKEQFTLDDLLSLFTTDESEFADNDDNLKIKLYEMRKKFHHKELSINDIKLIATIQEKVKGQGNQIYSLFINLEYRLDGFKNIIICKGKNEKKFRIGVMDDISEITADKIKELVSQIDIEEIAFESFKGLTLEKIRAFGERKYRIITDEIGLPEMEQILNILDNMKLQGNEPNEIDQFLTIYKCIGTSVIYDDSAKKGSEEYTKERGNLARGIVGPLIYGRAVCLGYAEALKYACDYFGIEAIVVRGNAIIDDKSAKDDESTGHAWNQVKINGIWYNTDLTWDVGEIKDLPYCLRKDEEFYKTHKNDDIQEKEVHICQEDYDIKELKERVRQLFGEKVYKFMFEEPEKCGIGKTEFEEIATTTAKENPDFSNEVVEGLREAQEQQEKGQCIINY